MRMCLVMPSLRETGGTVLIEAMAYGLPIVAFDTSFCTQLKDIIAVSL